MPQGQVFRRGVVAIPRRQSLTAAAQTFPLSGVRRDVMPRPENNHRWQEELWGFYDTCPEFAFGINWVGNLLAKAKLEVHELQPDGTWTRTTNQNALDVEASLFGGPAKAPEALRQIATNWEVAGDCWIINGPSTEGRDEDEWQIAASVEVTMNGNTLMVEGLSKPNGTMRTKIYKPHPRKSTEPNSPSRALLGTLRQLAKLSAVIDAQADSRLTSAGILWVPNEMELPTIPIQISADGGETFETVSEADGATGLYNKMIEIASIAIQNPGSAAAKVPLVISAPGEYLEKVQQTDFWSGFDKHVQGLRQELVGRIAIGMDMPPEIITGTGDVNHWGAWQIEEAAIKTHTEPLLDIIVSSIDEGILWPFLEAMGELDPYSFKFVADTSRLRMRPNRSKEALELYDRGAISIETLLVESGFDPDTDKPDAQEKIIWFLTQVAAKTSATPDQLSAVLAKLGVPGLPTLPAAEDARGAMDRPSLEQHPRRQEPDPEESEAGKERPLQAAATIAAPAAGFVLDGLLLASEVHVLRALERAGNKIKGKVGRNFVSAETPAREIYIGVPRMSLSECEELLCDAWSTLAATPYPGVDPINLESALNGYTLALLRRNAPHNRAALARHLLVELSE